MFGFALLTCSIPDPERFKIPLYPGFKARGFIEVVENDFRSVCEKGAQDSLLEWLVPLSVFFREHAAIAELELGADYVLVDNLLEGLARDFFLKLNSFDWELLQ